MPRSEGIPDWREIRLSDAASHRYGDGGGAGAAGSDGSGAAISGFAGAPLESAAATDGGALASPGLALAIGGGEVIPGEPEDDDGAGISSVLKGVALSPSGIAPGGGTLLFCIFKSAAGGTATEKLGSYMERIELAGMSFISRGPSELTKRER